MMSMDFSSSTYTYKLILPHIPTSISALGVYFLKPGNTYFVPTQGKDVPLPHHFPQGSTEQSILFYKYYCTKSPLSLSAPPRSFGSLARRKATDSLPI